MENKSFDRVNFPMVLLNLIQTINEAGAKVFLKEYKEGYLVGMSTESKLDSFWASICLFEDELYTYLAKNYFAATKPLKEEIDKNIGKDKERVAFELMRKVFRLLIAEAAANGFLIRQTENDEIVEGANESQ